MLGTKNREKMNKNSEIPCRYIYLDVEGIESLYVQIVEHNISEMLFKQEKGKKGKISGRLGLGKLLGNLLNLADIEVSPEIERSSVTETTTKATTSTEHKLRDLIKYLNDIGEPSLFSDLYRAADHCKNTIETVFVNVQETFDAPQFYSGRGHVDVNESQVIYFEKNICKTKDTYCHHDSYYRQAVQAEIPFFMSSNLLKYPSYKNGGMGATSHEAVMFRAFKGFDIPLNVFGAFFKLPSFSQIKPYAMWR